MSAAPRRLGLWIPWAIFGALAIGWVIYWNVLATGARVALERLVASQNAAGAEAHVGTVRTLGFPLQLALELNDVRYATRGSGLRISTPQLIAHINPANPQHLMATFPAPIDLTRGDKPHRITARAMRLSVRLHGRELARAGLSAEDFRMFDEEDGLADLEASTLVLNVRPDPRNSEDVQVSLTLGDATLKAHVRGFEALGDTINALDAAIVVEHADAISLRGDPLFAWRDAGGAARVEALRLVWGTLNATGAGRITLDDYRRLEGNLTLNVARPAETLETIAAEPDLPAQSRIQLRALAQLQGNDENFGAPLRAQDGALYLGQTFMRDLAPLYADATR